MAARPTFPAGYFLLASATAGAATLGLEVLAMRAMAPVLGSGSATWSSLLAVALGSLAAGNLLGGGLAARMPAGRVIDAAMLVAAVAVAGLGFFYVRALAGAAELPLI